MAAEYAIRRADTVPERMVVVRQPLDGRPAAIEEFGDLRPQGLGRFRRYDRCWMIEKGKPAPDFTLTSDAGETVTLSQFRGSPVVLYFYPKDDTPVSISQ